jgi:hypothetical protein
VHQVEVVAVVGPVVHNKLSIFWVELKKAILHVRKVRRDYSGIVAILGLIILCILANY